MRVLTAVLDTTVVRENNAGTRGARGGGGGPVSTSPYVWVGAATVNFPRCCRQFQQRVIGVKSMLIVSPGLVHEDASRQEHHHHQWWVDGRRLARARERS